MTKLYDMTKLWAFKIYVHISTRFEPPESVLYLKFMPDAEYDRKVGGKLKCVTHSDIVRTNSTLSLKF